MAENDPLTTDLSQPKRIAYTVRSLADSTGAILASGAVLIFLYGQLGRWMLDSGMIESQTYLIWTGLSFVAAVVLVIFTAMLLAERYESIPQHVELLQ